MNLTTEESFKITGGSVSAALVTGVVGAVKFIYGVGQDVGSAIKRLISGNRC